MTTRPLGKVGSNRSLPCRKDMLVPVRRPPGRTATVPILPQWQCPSVVHCGRLEGCPGGWALSQRGPGSVDRSGLRRRKFGAGGSRGWPTTAQRRPAPHSADQHRSNCPPFVTPKTAPLIHAPGDLVRSGRIRRTFSTEQRDRHHLGYASNYTKRRPSGWSRTSAPPPAPRRPTRPARTPTPGHRRPAGPEDPFRPTLAQRLPRTRAGRPHAAQSPGAPQDPRRPRRRTPPKRSRPGKKMLLPAPPPLRTGLTGFPISGSSIGLRTSS
jgi:hypothetical protein